MNVVVTYSAAGPSEQKVSAPLAHLPQVHQILKDVFKVAINPSYNSH